MLFCNYSIFFFFVKNSRQATAFSCRPSPGSWPLSWGSMQELNSVVGGEELKKGGCRFCQRSKTALTHIIETFFFGLSRLPKASLFGCLQKWLKPKSSAYRQQIIWFEWPTRHSQKSFTTCLVLQRAGSGSFGIECIWRLQIAIYINGLLSQIMPNIVCE